MYANFLARAMQRDIPPIRIKLHFHATLSKYFSLHSLLKQQALNPNSIVIKKKKKDMKDEKVISPEYILEPDEDLERAVSFDTVLEEVHAHIHEMFKDKD